MRQLVLVLAALGTLAALAGSASSTTTVQPLPPTEAQQLANTGSGGPTQVTAQQVTVQQALTLGGTTGASGMCWFTDGLNRWWGTWPYQQKLIEWRTWCADYLGGPQNYRVTQVHLDTFFCSGHDRFQYLVGGGNGYRYSNVRTGAYFDCATAIPWIVLHTYHWMEYSCNTWGHCELVTHN